MPTFGHGSIHSAPVICFFARRFSPNSSMELSGCPLERGVGTLRKSSSARKPRCDRVLNVDRAAATEYGKLVGQRDRLGRATSTMDSLIAAIARANRATLATRDTFGFSDLGIELVNPFEFVG